MLCRNDHDKSDADKFFANYPVSDAAWSSGESADPGANAFFVVLTKISLLLRGPENLKPAFTPCVLRLP